MAAATGAGHVTDDTPGSFTQAPQKHDGVIDTAGNQTLPGTRAGTGPERRARAGRRPDEGCQAGPPARPSGRPCRHQR
jgi:hypothetical protein